MMEPTAINRAASLDRAAGFTLIELMVVLTITAVVIGLAVPSFSKMALRSGLYTHSNGLVSSVVSARELARGRKGVAMCVSSDGATCGTGGWEQGYLVMCKSDDLVNCTSAGAKTLVFASTPATKTGWKITEANGQNIVQFIDEAEMAEASWLVCQSAPAGAEERKVMLNVQGKASVQKKYTGVCN